MKAPRPASIRWFEPAAILVLTLNALQVYRNLFTSTPLPSDLLRLRTLGLTVYVAIAAVILLLIWLIGRRRSTLAKWIYISLNLARVAGSITIPFAIGHMPPTFSPLAWAQLIVLAGSIWLLFRPDARQWFAGAPPVDPGIFR